MGSSTPQSVVECAVHGALPDGCRKGSGRCPNSKVMRLCPFNSFQSYHAHSYATCVPFTISSDVLGQIPRIQQRYLFIYVCIFQTLSNCVCPHPAGLCPRVRRGLRPCAGKKEKGCDAEGAADLLPKKRTELDQIILAKAQGLIGGCAQKRGLCM